VRAGWRSSYVGWLETQLVSISWSERQLVSGIWLEMDVWGGWVEETVNK